MTGKLRNKWLRLYECADRIGNLEPWEIFDEGDKFAYIWKAKNKTLYFSFIAESADRCGIACYDGGENYARARKRLTAAYDKQEPTFALQNACICLWGNREDLNKPTYELIKELGFSFRGKGAWLFFQRFETGYEPTLPNERDLDLMLEGFENLFMMVRAVRNGAVDPQFDKGLTLTRWYEAKDKLYYTHPFQVPEPAVPKREIRVKKGPLFDNLLKAPMVKAVWDLDWSYLPTLMKDDKGRWEFPLLFLCVDEESGLVLFGDMIESSQDAIGEAIEYLSQTLVELGRPASIAVCDDDLKASVEDLCRKAGVKLSVKKRLPALETARDAFIKTL